MVINRNKLEDLLNELPEELQSKVVQFAESLLQRNRRRDGGDSTQNLTPLVRSFFGIWDSGDPRSADSERIDADLAREYAGTQEADS